MFLTSSGETASISVLDGLRDLCPILHITTDSLQQVMAIMDRAFFGTDDPSDANLRYVSLKSLCRKKEPKEEKPKESVCPKNESTEENLKDWLPLLRSEKKVVYLTAGSEGKLSSSDTERLIEYQEQFQLWQYTGKAKLAIQSRVVVYGRNVTFPSVLQAHVARIELPELKKDDFRKIIISLLNSSAQEQRDPNFQQRLDDLSGWYACHMAGLSENKVRSLLQKLHFDGHLFNNANAAKLIRWEKNKLLQINNILECVPPEDDIQGLVHVRKWLNVHKKNITRMVFKKSEDITKGLLLLGLPGTGKSKFAKCSASILGLPLIKLDIARLLDKYVGESEKNLYRVLDDLIVAGAPCVLWIDEIEKAYGGSHDEGGSASVITRLLGEMLKFMQEMERTVFIIATANDISSLPPELFRACRISQIFGLMLPPFSECASIMQANAIHHLGSCDTKMAENLIDICAGLKKWSKDGLADVNNPDCVRFLTGADINEAAKEMTIAIGLDPGEGNRGDASDDDIYASMQSYANNFRAFVDTNLPFTLEMTAKSYVNVFEQGALPSSDAKSPLSRANYQPGKVTSKAPEKYEHPQCLKEMKMERDIFSAYDWHMYLSVGKAMDQFIRERPRRNN